MVQHRYHELRDEADQYRLARTNQAERGAGPSLADRLRSLLVRAVTHQPAIVQAKANA